MKALQNHKTTIWCPQNDTKLTLKRHSAKPQTPLCEASNDTLQTLKRYLIVPQTKPYEPSNNIIQTL